MELGNQDLLEIYRQMVLTRIFETKTNEWNVTGQLKESNHQSIGQEAISLGACYGLRKTDQVMPSLRTRGAFFAKGVSTKTTLLNMAVKKTSQTLGHETSHHSPYPELGVLAGTGMVGSSIAIGTGAALAIQMKNKDDVVLNFFGDGASNRGDFHESINIAAVWKLPCIYIIENNQIAINTKRDQYLACKRLSDRAVGYGIPGYTIDGNDVLEVYKYTQIAIERARKGEGPTLLDCETFRMRPHVGILKELRPQEIINEWAEKDPILRLEKYLINNNVAAKEELHKIYTRIDKELDDEFESIKSEPEAVLEDMLNNVYEEDIK